jgi:phosphatidylglycerophosphate synthase
MSHNTWIHRIVRLGVRPLVDTPVTPNHLTWLRLACGLGAAAGFAAGEGSWPAVGGGLFVVSMALDRADGELARLSGKTSPFGHKLDLVTDALCNALAFVGLGLGLPATALGGWGSGLGLLAGLAVAAVLMLVIRLEAMAGERAGEVQGAAGFDPDDAMLAVPLGVWLGLSQWLVLAAAIGAPLFAAGMYVTFLLMRRGRQKRTG